MLELVARRPAFPELNALFRDKGWLNHIGWLALGWLAIATIFASDVAHIVSIWWNSATYNHCFFIPLILWWLIEQRRPEVAKLIPQRWMPGAWGILGAALIWMLGEAAQLAQIRHFGVMFMMQSMVVAMLGPNVARALAFPLFYAIFMVPAGDELVPLLQTITAKMCMGLLAIFQIPAHINGIFITIPNGYYKVAEACSGVKFLVAMVAYGALVANVCFRSWSKRIAFMAVAIAVPIAANGVRAFGTIYVGWLTDKNAAAGFDHVVYGWFFFAAVMALVMALGWRFFDRKPNDAWLAGFKPWSWPKTARTAPFVSVSALVLLAPMLWLSATNALGRVPMPNAIALPDVAGWERTKASGHYWDARFDGADHRLIGHYRDTKGGVVDLSVALYANQGEGKKIVGYAQGAVDPKGDWSWAANTPAPAGGRAERIVTQGPTNREVWSFYVTADGSTGSAGAVKLATLKARLSGRDQAAAAILISAVDTPQHPARDALARFLKDFGEPQGRARGMVRAAQGR